MEFYRLYSQINYEQKVYDFKRYKTFSEAETVLREMIAAQGKKMNIASYISAIRKGKNRNYRKIIADALKNIFLETEPLSAEKITLMQNAIDDYNDDCQAGDKEPMNDFNAYIEERIVILEFNFNEKLHLEFDINTQDSFNDGIFYSYFFIEDSTGKFKVNIDPETETDLPQKRSNSSSIVCVYTCLTDHAYHAEDELTCPNHIPRGMTPKEMKKINSHISTETIVKHIKILKKLGIPIKQYKISKAEKEFWEARHKCYNEGYEIDPDFREKVPEPIDASGLGIQVNPLLVLFVLKSSDEPLRQADMIEVIKEKYNVNIARAAVGRHIDLLKGFGYPIEKTKNGYIFRK